MSRSSRGVQKVERWCGARVMGSALVAVALVVGCGPGAQPRPPTPAAPPATDELLTLAPAGTRVALVAAGPALALYADGYAWLHAIADRASSSRELLRRTEAAVAARLGLPSLAPSALGLGGAGGLAWFELDDGHVVSLWPVADHDAFLTAFGGRHTEQGDVLTIRGRTLGCLPYHDRQLCADDPRGLSALGTGALAGLPARAGARGDVELVVLSAPSAGGAGPPSLALVASLALAPGELELHGWTGALTGATDDSARHDPGQVSGWAAVTRPRALAHAWLAQVPALSRVLAALRGPLTASVPSGVADVDVRLPLADPATVRGWMAACAERPRLGDVELGPDGDGCRLAAAGPLDAALTAWIDGDTLRASRTRAPVAAARGPAPSARGRALLERPWTAVVWGRGSVLPDVSRGLSLGDLGPVVTQVAGSLAELGLGVGLGPDGTSFALLVRTIHTNPPEVVEAALALLARAGRGQDVTAEVRALAAAHPSSPLAADLAAGSTGLLVPVSMSALVAGLIVGERAPAPPATPDEIARRSAEILGRTDVAAHALVKHVLVGWQGQGHSTSTRTRDEAAALAGAIAAELVRDPAAIDALMRRHSEDPGSAATGRAYPVTPTSGLVAPFRELSLRLQVGEVGVVETDFGFHVIVRLPPPPRDPLASKDILGRALVTSRARFQHILLGWDVTHNTDPRGAARTRAELEALLALTLARLDRGEPFERLMAELSEDPYSASSGDGYEVTPDSGLVEPLVSLALRLRIGELGVVTSPFGLHIVRRTE